MNFDRPRSMRGLRAGTHQEEPQHLLPQNDRIPAGCKRESLLCIADFIQVAANDSFPVVITVRYPEMTVEREPTNFSKDRVLVGMVWALTSMKIDCNCILDRNIQNTCSR